MSCIFSGFIPQGGGPALIRKDLVAADVGPSRLSPPRRSVPAALAAIPVPVRCRAMPR